MKPVTASAWKSEFFHLDESDKIWILFLFDDERYWLNFTENTALPNPIYGVTEDFEIEL